MGKMIESGDWKLILPVETEGSDLLRRVEGAEVEVSTRVRHCSLLLLGPARTFTWHIELEISSLDDASVYLT